MTLKQIADSLAEAMLRGPFAQTDLVKAVNDRLGQPQAFAGPLARRVLAYFGEKRRPRHHLLRAFLQGDDGLHRALKKLPRRLPVELEARCTMQPVSAAREWPVPPICDAGELMHWLRLGEGEMLWLADPKGLEREAREGGLRNYRYRWMTKPSGGARLIESPKGLLRSLQRRVLHGILDHIPAHDSAHGFRAGRSIRSFALPHVNQAVVLRLDLREFFPSVSRMRVVPVFLAAGYPEKVAMLLASLCTNVVPSEVLDACPAKGKPEIFWWQRKRLAGPHLPQGAPTSPALANLCAFHLDCRLAGLAKACGAQYTRYADDLVFSGDEAFARQAGRFSIRAAAIILEEGFQVNMRKTKLMRRSVSQRAAGLVLNEGLNVSRAEFDQLKAVLHNCLKHGPQTQNRAGHADFRAHLEGRVAHVCQIAPARGAKLRAMLERVDWC